MASPYHLTDNELLTLGEQAIENSLSDDMIAAAVAPFGYDEQALQRGRALLDAFRGGVEAKRRKHSEKVSATLALGEAWDAFHEKTYMPDVSIARVVFDDEAGARQRLGVDGDRPRAFDDYVQEARGFYDTLESDTKLQTRMTERGLPRRKWPPTALPSTSWCGLTACRSARRARHRRRPASATTCDAPSPTGSPTTRSSPRSPCAKPRIWPSS